MQLWVTYLCYALWLCCVPAGHAVHIMDLGSSASWTQWTVSGGPNISIPATVPGGIYTDLSNAGVLRDDIYYRFNDLEYRWVG